MAYATVADVEARLGFTLDMDEAQKLEFFLEDFSIYLDARFDEKGIDPSTIAENILKMITARKGASFVMQDMTGAPYGATSFTETSGDTSTSITLASQSNNFGGFFLTRQEESLLKLYKAKIITFTLDNGRC